MTASNNRLGFLLMTITSLLFALQDGISRHLAAEYNVYMIVMVRMWFFAAFALFLAHRNGGILVVARSKKPWLQWARGTLLVLEICVTVAAFTLLGLTETHAIFVCYPLIIVALSGPLLGEKIGLVRWSAVLVGFIGVLIILQPGSGVFSPLAIIPLVGAAMFALYGVMTRYVGRYDSSTTSFFYIGTVGCAVMTAIGVFHWESVAGANLAWLLLLCAMGILGHWMLIKTYEVAEASAVQPFAYLQMPFAVTVGMLAFSETLRMNVAIGAAVIIGAGMFALWRERQRANELRHD
jgi:drug/metabolite transporter (DMT)-like permease